VTTADYALLVSLFSAVVAVAGFVWNVWQKFIYPKARLRISFYEGCIIGGPLSGPPWPTYLCLGITNHGPTDVIVNTVGIVIAPNRFWQRGQHAFVNPIADISRPEIGVGPFGGGLPKKLAVGESHTLYFPHNSRSFAREKLRRVGVIDNFGRSHSASQKQIRIVKTDLDKAFADQPYSAMDMDRPESEE
jgi:hypothetical protein